MSGRVQGLPIFATRDVLQAVSVFYRKHLIPMWPGPGHMSGRVQGLTRVVYQAVSILSISHLTLKRIVTWIVRVHGFPSFVELS